MQTIAKKGHYRPNFYSPTNFRETLGVGAARVLLTGPTIGTW